jgi:hypothetical protein
MMQNYPYSWQPVKSSQFSGLVPQGIVSRTDHRIRLKDRLDHLQVRLGINRMGHRIGPGIYRIGDPGPESRVFVTANYTLSFDALRSSLKDLDAYILVLDTSGINVWCAAGKGTFGTDELVRKIEETNLAERLNHRSLILPQLGAPGVSAHEVRERSGFRVKYGPVRASDIPAYLGTGKVSSEARRVKFTLGDRLTLVPVELKQVLLPMLLVAAALFFTVGLLPALALTGAVLAGSAVFPVMLPWLPTKNFSTKGFILGGAVAGVFAIAHMLRSQHHPLVYVLVCALAYLFTLPPLTAFLSLNFTGATTFTSRSGVRKEINTYFPLMVWMAGGGVLLFVAAVILSITLI